MNVVLWILQVVLAAMFATSGFMKLTQPKEKLVGRLAWVGDFSPATVRFIGIAELAAALGLILPAATGIAPVLTPPWPRPGWSRSWSSPRSPTRDARNPP
jgi:uncharacterized membrane protein YphA (DoxX/SURF4 family)